MAVEPPPLPGARASVSWGRAVLHAVLAFGAVLVGGAVLAGVLGMAGSDAHKAGQSIGRLAGLVAGAAFGASYLLQTRRRGAALALAIALVALVGAGAAAGIMTRSPHRDTSLTAAEKQPLVIGDDAGERRLRHPGLGFSILHPGPKFLEAAELGKPKPGQKHDDTTQEYAFADREGRSVLLVSVMKGMGGTREKLAEHLDGVQRGFVGSLPEGAPLHWGDKQIRWTDERHQARLVGAFGGGMGVQIAAYSVLRDGQEPFIVNVMIIAPDADRYTRVTESFRSQP
jgi:hypothetical protein